MSADLKTLATAFEALRADYDMAKDSRYRRRRSGIPHGGAGADWHLRSDQDYLKMLETARDYERNDTITSAALTRFTDLVIQQGFKVNPQTEDEALDSDIVARWTEYASDADQCDAARERTFAEQERLVFRQSLLDGDVFVLPLRDGRIQLIEGHRCRTPKNTSLNVVNGIRLNDLREKVEFWFTKDEIEPWKSFDRVGDVIKYPARGRDGQRQVLQVYHKARVSQTRGVTILSPITDLISMLGDINFAKLVQQQFASFFALIRNRENDFEGGAPTGFDQRTEEKMYDLGGARTAEIENLSPGMEYTAQPGERLEGFSPNIPNPEFFDHVKWIVQLISSEIGMPFQVLFLDASQTNYSGWRGAMNQARIGFMRHQAAFAAKFHRPLYLWKLRQWIGQDAALRRQAERLGPLFFRHIWSTPRWESIEPDKDARARTMRLANGINSPRREHAQEGIDWSELVTEIIDDNSSAIRKAMTEAQAINEEFKDSNQSVHWRELLPLPTPEGVKLLFQAQSGFEDEEEGEDGGEGGKAPAPNEKRTERGSMIRHVS